MEYTTWGIYSSKICSYRKNETNIDIWDFALTEEEMERIFAKDLGHSEIVNHDDPAFVKFIYNLH